MNLATSKALFYAKHKRQQCYPCGTPFNRIVDDHGVPVRIRVPKPVVRFEQNKYETEDEEIALGLVADVTNFAKPWGWHLDIECISEDIRELYNACPPSEKAKVASALIKGASTEEAIELIDLEKLVVVPEMKAPPQHREDCPVEGCEVAITGDVTPSEAQKAMEAHVRTMHPDWKGKNAEAKTA